MTTASAPPPWPDSWLPGERDLAEASAQAWAELGPAFQSELTEAFRKQLIAVRALEVAESADALRRRGRLEHEASDAALVCQLSATVFGLPGVTWLFLTAHLIEGLALLLGVVAVVIACRIDRHGCRIEGSRAARRQYWTESARERG